MGLGFFLEQSFIRTMHMSTSFLVARCICFRLATADFLAMSSQTSAVNSEYYFLNSTVRMLSAQGSCHVHASAVIHGNEGQSLN